MKEKAILTKLRDFCIENDIDISVGCGCCGAGIYYKKEGHLFPPLSNRFVFSM